MNSAANRERGSGTGVIKVAYKKDILGQQSTAKYYLSVGSILECIAMDIQLATRDVL
jgi:hypothetical protein